jgi:hypothetical protein
MQTDRPQTRNWTIRGAWTAAAVVALVLASFLAAGSPARAATTGSVCRDVTVQKTVYHWSVVGTGLSCTAAKPWLVKFASAHYRPSSGTVTLHNGPRGYKCSATLMKVHLFTVVCYVGTFAHPTRGFQALAG